MMSKALDISSATTRVAPDLLKALTILSDTTVRRSPVDQEHLKPYWKSEKNATFFYVIKERKKMNRVVVVSCRPFSNILKHRDPQ